MMDFGHCVVDDYPRAGDDCGTPVALLGPSAGPAGADIRALVAAGLSRRQIANRLGVSKTEKLDVALRAALIVPASVPLYPPAEVLRRMYVEQGKTDTQVGEALGITTSDAAHARRHYGIPGRAPVAPPRPPRHPRPSRPQRHSRFDDALPGEGASWVRRGEYDAFVSAGLRLLTPPENDPRADRVGRPVYIRHG